MQTHYTGIMPALFDAGKGELHRTDVGQKQQIVLGERLDQQAANAIEERIPRGQYYGFMLLIGGLEALDNALHVSTNHQPFPLPVREKCQVPLPACQHLRAGDVL